MPILVGWPKEEMQRRMDFIRAHFSAQLSQSRRDKLKDDRFNQQSGRCIICLYDLLGFDGSLSVLDHSTSIYNWAEQHHMPLEELAQYANAEYNLRLAHVECNIRKGAIELEEFHSRKNAGEFELSSRRALEESRTYQEERNRLAGLAGRAAWDQMTPDERHQFAVKGGKARWAQWATRTPRQKEEQRKRMNANRTPEQKEALRVLASGLYARKTPEQKAAQPRGWRVPGLGNHHKWHLNRNQFNPDCSFCRASEVPLAA
jgi:hypothetical protein